jgi:hypothetical protein
MLGLSLGMAAWGLVTGVAMVKSGLSVPLAVLMSLVGAFYYLRLVKVMYFDSPITASEVVAGAEVLDKIAAVPTGEKALKARSGESLREAPMQDVPNENVVIQSIKVVTE